MSQVIRAAVVAAKASPRKVAAIVAAASLAITTLIVPWEGKENVPYIDIAGVPTVCFGETTVAMRRYDDAQCLAMVERRVGRDFAPQVARCSPGIVDRPRVFASAISLSYNIGVAAYCGSTAARRFAAGDLRGGCEAMSRWNQARVNGRLRVVQGLDNRRRAEVKLCLSGVA